MLVTEFDL